MTQHPDLFAALAAPFEPEEVKLRTQAGRQLHYVTARTVMNRLDDVLGPEAWWDSYIPGEHSVVCTLTIRLPDGQVLAKTDAGGMAGMADPGDDDKSGFADAFKRAAVKFGVGRYLYRDGIPRFATRILRKRAQDPHPSPGTPLDEPPAPSAPVVISHLCDVPKRPGGNSQEGDAPRSGKALFAWAKKLDEDHDYGIVKHLNKWAKLRDFSYKMIDWTGAQVAAAFEEACVRRDKLEAEWARTVDATNPRQPVTQREADMPDDQWGADRE